MKCVHVLRKPCSESTVAANVLRWGTGGLHIDACRIGTSDDLNGGAYAKRGTGRHDGAESWRYHRDGSAGVFQPPSGRWPANLIFQHLPGCVQDGTRSVTGQGHYPASRPRGSQVSGPAGHVGQQDLPESHLRHETVVAWACAPGCPVAALDVQSGDLSSQATRRDPDKASRDTGMFGVSRKQKNGPEYLGQTGGASRFFKQVKP